MKIAIMKRDGWMTSAYRTPGVLTRNPNSPQRFPFAHRYDWRQPTACPRADRRQWIFIRRIWIFSEYLLEPNAWYMGV